MNRSQFFSDVLPGLTCSEIDRIAEVLLDAGKPDAAALIIERHAWSDESPQLTETPDRHAHLINGGKHMACYLEQLRSPVAAG